MIRTVLIDDEPEAITGLELELALFNDVDIVQTFTDAADAIPYIHKHEVDVVFLDMAMPTLSGLQFLKSFDIHDFIVVFCTAYSEFAISAVKNEALDYLLKPVDAEDLKICIDKIRKRLATHSSEQSIHNAINALNSLYNVPQKIKIFSEGKIQFIQPTNIVCCEGDGSYTHIHFEHDEQVLMVSKRLKILEELLPKDLFIRVHKSYIVNISSIIEFHQKEGFIVLTNGQIIPVSRSKKKGIMDKL